MAREPGRREPNGGAAVLVQEPPPILTPPAPDTWRHRHVLDLDDFSKEEIGLVMETAGAMKEVLARPIPRIPTLRGTTIITVFYEASTRTRSSFEWRAKPSART